MPLNVLDSSTWVASTLTTPEGDVTYWVLADLDAYYEQWEEDDNLTRVKIAVAWDDAGLFKRYALGFAERYAGVPEVLRRHNPLPNPWAGTQFLRSLRKVGVHAGVNSTGAHPRVSLHTTDPLADNWFTFLPTDGIPPRIVYEAVFRVLPWDVISQDSLMGHKHEEVRNVIPEDAVRPRERKHPSYGFEVTIGADVVPVPEVGFVPYYDYELRRTWKGVPWELVPNTAIAACLLRANDDVWDWDYKANAYGRYQEGDVVFMGLASPLKRYRGTNGEWLADLPYVFRYQPADGTGDGMLKVPYLSATSGNIWVQPRIRGSAASPKYMYEKADLSTLFQPEPA